MPERMENLIWCSNFGPYDFSKRLLWNIIFPSKENFLIMRCHCLAVPASKSTIGFLYSKQKTKTVGTFPVFSSSVPYSQELTFLHFLKGYSTIQASLVAQLIKNLPAMRETWVWSLGWEDPLEKGKYKNSPEFWPGELHGLCVCVCVFMQYIFVYIVCIYICIHAGLTKHGPLEKGMANHFSILALRNAWTVWKGKKVWHWKMSSVGRRCPICYWRRAEKYLQKEWREWAKAKTTPSRGCDGRLK